MASILSRAGMRSDAVAPAVPVLTLPPGFKPSDEDMAAIRAMLDGMATGTRPYLVLPHGFTLQLVHPHG